MSLLNCRDRKADVSFVKSLPKPVLNKTCTATWTKYLENKYQHFFKNLR